MHMKSILFGSKGYLGQHFLRRFPESVCPSIDIADVRAVSALFDTEQPDIVINAAGKTGTPNVDWCEDHRAETLHANVTGPLVLVEECAKRGIYLVHLSSGCIYAGENSGAGYGEDDEPNFSGSFYSRTKAWSEQILKEFPDTLIVRLRMPFDGSMNPKNLIMKVRAFSRVNDVKNSITYVPDFINATAQLIEKRKSGIYNIVNPGSVSPYEIVELYTDIVDPSHSAERVSMDQLSGLSKAGRSNCVLNTQKLENEGIRLMPVQEALRKALEEIAEG